MLISWNVILGMRLSKVGHIVLLVSYSNALKTTTRFMRKSKTT